MSAEGLVGDVGQDAEARKEGMGREGRLNQPTRTGVPRLLDLSSLQPRLIQSFFHPSMPGPHGRLGRLAMGPVGVLSLGHGTSVPRNTVSPGGVPSRRASPPFSSLPPNA